MLVFLNYLVIWAHLQFCARSCLTACAGDKRVMFVCESWAGSCTEHLQSVFHLCEGEPLLSFVALSLALCALLAEPLLQMSLAAQPSSSKICMPVLRGD